MRKFILHWGEMGSTWGINRTVAQIYALLYLSPTSLTAEEISETLSVARSTVSTGLRELQEAYPLHEATVEPKLYVVMTDNWLEMTLRYVVAPRERRKVQGQLHRELLQSFESNPKITVASVTMEIVGFPPLRRDDEIA